MQNPWLSYPDSRSRSHFKVMEFTLEFHVRSINSLTLWTIVIKLHPNVSLSETVCRTHKLVMQTQGQGHTSRSWDLLFNFVSTIYILSPLKDFYLTSLKCSPKWVGIQNPWLSYADTRSRPHFKVMGFTLQFCVHCIYPKSFERFSLNFTQMFLSVWCCVETLTQLCRHKIKVTLQCHGIYPSILCPLYIS